MNTFRKCERCGALFDLAADVGLSISTTYLHRESELKLTSCVVCPACTRKFKQFMKGENNLG